VFDVHERSELAYSNGFPERIAVLPPFRIDKYEVSVARFRDALSRGFNPSTIIETNNGPIDPNADPTTSKALCTFSAMPLDREQFPMNCIDPLVARAFCQFDGGDLPSEAEWEYVAQQVGRPNKTRFPWGDAAPTCTTTIYERAAGVMFASSCAKQGPGPRPIADPASDKSISGAIDLGGNMSEWMVDSFHAFDSNCWARASLFDPRCLDPSPTYYSRRGGSWAETETALYAGHRVGSSSFAGIAGMRCVRSVP
jgi:formylglycine-generating enzyme required for sulfatase activity